MSVVVIDHHDSFTHNLTHLIGAVTGSLPPVLQHDEASVDDLAGFTHVVLSPGPGHAADPRDFALGGEVLRAADDRPVLGVCLGLQGIVSVFGGELMPIEPAHGRVSTIRHDGSALFSGVPETFPSVRYHSWAVADLPPELRATAHAECGTVMAVAHRERPIVGVQFHPESVLSRCGESIVANFVAMR